MDIATGLMWLVGIVVTVGVGLLLRRRDGLFFLGALLTVVASIALGAVLAWDAAIEKASAVVTMPGWAHGDAVATLVAIDHVIEGLRLPLWAFGAALFLAAVGAYVLITKFEGAAAALLGLMDGPETGEVPAGHCQQDHEHL